MTVKELFHPKHLIQNIFLHSILILFLSIYSARLSMTVHNSFNYLFKNILFRSIIVFLISYLSSSNFSISLVLSIIFVVTIHTIEIEHFIKSEIISSKKRK